MNTKNIVITVLAGALIVLGIVMTSNTGGLSESDVKRIVAETVARLGGTTNFDDLSLSQGLSNVATTTRGTSATISEAGVHSGGLSCLVETGTFDDATNTLAFIQSPFVETSASSSATFVSINGTNGTTSTRIIVATSTPPATSPTSADTFFEAPLLDTGYIATSTTFTNYSGELYGGTSSPITRARIGTNDGIAFFALGQLSSGDEGGVTGLDNTFSGTYKVEFCQ